MADLIKNGERSHVDYMARDYDRLLAAMRELIPEKLPEWTDHTAETDFGNVLLQLFAHMGDILSYYQDRIANESFLSTAQSRASVIHHLRLIGYRLATAAPASASLTLSVPGTTDAVVTLRKGDAFATKSREDAPAVRFEYTREQPLLIDFATIAPDGSGRKRFRGIPVEEGKLVRDEFLGASDGRPNQRFALGQPRLVLRARDQAARINPDVVLTVESAGRIEAWHLVESLALATRQQKVASIEVDDEDRATLVFGDGTFGAVPPKGGVVRATYRVGGGRQGNVPAASIETIVDASQVALAAGSVTNEAPATGGADRESIEDAVRQAPAVFRSQSRAVTADDYKALARRIKGVGKVRAEAGNWNTVDLFIAPEGGGHISDVLRAQVLAYFEDKRQLTTRIRVHDVDYVSVYVTANIGLESFYTESLVREQVAAVAGSLLAFDQVDFGKTLYLSKFFEAVEGVEGVAFVNISEFRSAAMAPGEPVALSGKIELLPHQVPRIPLEPAYAAGLRIVIEEAD